jgi:hypothetical protein
MVRAPSSSPTEGSNMKIVRYKDWKLTHADKLVNWPSMMASPTKTDKKSVCLQELERLGSEFALTDAITHYDMGGIYFLEALQAESEGRVRLKNAARNGTRLFCLRCLAGEKGEPVKAGDVVSWKVDNVRTDAAGKPLTTRKAKDMARRGEEMEIRNDAVVDDDLCIYVPYRDASILLHQFGTQETSKKREKGRDGHPYNWRFCEQPLWLRDGQAGQDSLGDPEAKRRGRPRLDGGSN